jgi:hypothetical protein
MRCTLNTGGLTGLTGTLGYALYNADGTLYQARATTGITEVPASSGLYGVAVSDSILAGRMIVWDTDNGAPLYGSEEFPSDLDGYQAGATVARSMATLATRAWILYPQGDPAQYLEFVTEGMHRFAHECFGLFVQTASLATDTRQGVYDLPGDYHQLRPATLALYSGGVFVQALELLERDAVETDRAGVIPYGVPSGFYFVDGLRYGLDPVPLTDAYTINFQYDAGLPTSLLPSDELPIPPVFERALIGYAVAQMAEMQNDGGRAEMFMARFTDGLNMWQRDAAVRQRAPAQFVPVAAYRDYDSDEE